jgi:hypothetical protein
MCNWNHLTIIQEIAEKYNWKARHQLTRIQEFLGAAPIGKKILTQIYRTFIKGNNVTCRAG